MKQNYLYIVIMVAVIGIFLGGIISQSSISKLIPPKSPTPPGTTEPPQTSEKKENVLSKEELANKTLAYIVDRFLKPQGVSGELESIEELGENLYIIKIRARSGEQTQSLPPLYVTKDGLMIVIGEGGGIVNISEKPKPEETEEIKRINVSVDDDPCIGPDDAPVIVIEFSDFQCPFCSGVAGFHEGVIARMKSKDPNWEPPVPKLEELAREGKIKFVYRDFPLTSIHPQAQKAAEAAQCAEEQGMFWEMHDKLFKGQSEWSGSANAQEIFKRYASDLGLNISQFNSCLDSGKYASEIQKDYQDGIKAGVTGTPAFFINGIPVKGAVSFSTLNQIIQSEMEGKPPSKTGTSETCRQ
jgi:protein-disulfide isomerase